LRMLGPFDELSSFDKLRMLGPFDELRSFDKLRMLGPFDKLRAGAGQPSGAGANSRASARHTCSDVSGICTRSASRPSPARSSASMTAVTTVGVAPIVPSSPTPLTPSV